MKEVSIEVGSVSGEFIYEFFDQVRVLQTGLIQVVQFLLTVRTGFKAVLCQLTTEFAGKGLFEYCQVNGPFGFAQVFIVCDVKAFDDRRRIFIGDIGSSDIGNEKIAVVFFELAPQLGDFFCIHVSKCIIPGRW